MLSLLLPLGTVFFVKKSKQHYTSLGDVYALVVLGWPMTRMKAKGPHVVLTLADDTPPTQLSWLTVLKQDDVMVVPCEVASPLLSFIRAGHKLTPGLGVRILESGCHLPFAEHAARNGFWQLPVHKLQRLAGLLGHRWPGAPLLTT